MWKPCPPFYSSVYDVVPATKSFVGYIYMKLVMVDSTMLSVS